MPVIYPKLDSSNYRHASVENDPHDQERYHKRPRAADGEYNPSLLQEIMALNSISAAKAKHNVEDQDVDMREGPVVEEEESDNGDHQRSIKYTIEQRKAISRARKYGKKKDYYGAMGLEGPCTTEDIRRRYKILAPLIHTDHTKFPDAKKAFERFNEGYEILKDPEKKKKYDKKYEKYYKIDNLNDEEFASNASGSDSNVTSADDSDIELKEMKPGKSRRKLYKNATPAVQKILSNPEHERSLSKIEKINREIKDQNVKEGCDKTAFLIKSSSLVEMGKYARTAQNSLAKNSNDKRAKRTMKHTAEQLQTVIRNFSYPSEWFPSEWLDFLTIEVEEEGSHMRSNKDKGRKKQSSSSISKHSPQETSIGKVKWRPGLTKNGEKILGYVPYVRRRGVYDFDTGKPVHPILRAEFVIEKLGEPNPMALVTHTQLGKKAFEAYMKLPKERRNDLQRTEWKYADEDPDNFDEDDDERLKAFASIKTDSDNYPQGYGLYKRRDKSEVIMSRTCARWLFGPNEADREIQEFFPRVGERVPWRKRIESRSLKQIGWRKENRLAKATQYDSDISTSSSIENSESELEINRRTLAKLGGKARVSVKSSGDVSSSDSSEELERSGRASVKLNRKGKRAIRDNEISEVSSSSDSEDSSSSDSELERGRRAPVKRDRTGKRAIRDDETSEDNSSSDSEDNSSSSGVEKGRRAVVKLDRKGSRRVKFVEPSRDSSSRDISESRLERSRRSLTKVDRKGRHKGKGKLDKVYRDKAWRAALEKMKKDLAREMTRGHNRDFKKLAKRALIASTA